MSEQSIELLTDGDWDKTGTTTPVRREVRVAGWL